MFWKKSIGAFIPSTIFFFFYIPDKFQALLAKGNKFICVLLNHLNLYIIMKRDLELFG